MIDGREPVPDASAHGEPAELRRFYGRDNSPMWLDPAGQPTLNAQDALAMLTRAADDGLTPADYGVDALNHMWADMHADVPGDLARFDVRMSAGMLRYLHDLHNGRIDPRAVGFRLDSPVDRPDFAALLRSAIAERRMSAAAEDLWPPLAQYRSLREMLARYRLLASDPTLAAVPPFTSPVHAGEHYAAAGVLHHQLTVFGDLPVNVPAPSAARYEGDVVEGLKRFQIRHGLQPDGVLGKGTIASLRIPVTWRVRQIELALERLRWVPRPDDERLIVVNLPMFRLWAWDANPPIDAPSFGMDAIVGRALKTETPIFVAEMREVIFRPYWNVPSSILLHEVLPRLERDPDYLRREDMEIVGRVGGGESEFSADALAGLRSGALRIRQRPGPKSALGAIKFVFPNQDDVYMHGTPAQSLFAKSRRDFSHGCVRVADPVALATWVLRDLPQWTHDRIAEAAAGSQTIGVKLPHPVRVILFYTTAAMTPEDNTIRFAEDIYQQDGRLDRLLAVRSAPE